MTSQSGGPAPAQGPNRNLLLRIASAAVMAPLALASAYFGGWPFGLFWLAASCAIWWEWLGLLGARDNRMLLAAGSVAFAGALLAAMLIRSMPLALAIVLCGVTLAAAVDSRHRGWAGAGILYAGLLLVASIGLRADVGAGLLAILLLFAIVWATDIFAYFVGRAAGGPKLAPAISPNKTWSGAAGGLLAALAAGLAVLRPIGIESILGAGLIILLLSAVSQGGDLFESHVKRLFQAKDTGTLIPGHGGVMDRLDGFVAAVVVAYIVGVLRGGWEAPAQGLVRW